MSKLVDIIACAGITIFEFSLILIIASLAQLIVYQLTGFSIYNETLKGLKRLDKYLTKKFN